MKALVELGKIAGIAGISLGIIFLLFRQLIAKNIFPNLTRDQSYKILRLVIILLFIIGIFGMVLWTINPILNKSQPPITDPIVNPIKDTLSVKNKKIRIHVVDSKDRGYFLDTINRILNPVFKDSDNINIEKIASSLDPPDHSADLVIIHLHAFGQNDTSNLKDRLFYYYNVNNKKTQFIVYSRSFQYDNGKAWRNNATTLQSLKNKIATIYLPNAPSDAQKQNLIDSVERKIQLLRNY